MRRAFKVAGWILLAFIVAVVGAVSLAAAKWSMHAGRRIAVPRVDLTDLKGDVKRGEYMVQISNGCAECHGEDLAGKKMVENPALGRIYGPNITPWAIKNWTDGEIAATIHHGVSRNGRPLVIMPAEVMQHLCRQDLADMVAYLRSVPPVARPNVPIRVGPLFTVIYATVAGSGMLPAEMVDHAAPYADRVPEGPTRAYGEYLYRGHCAGCHKDDGTGGHISAGPPDWPPAANLTVDGAGGWTQEGFIRTFRTGINPSGGKIRPPMGESIEKVGKKMKDVELKALWEYLRTLKGVELS
jgi:mono/diheme cytochrome c family protein